MTSPMLSSSIALSQLLAREHTTSSVGNVNMIEPKNTTGESSIPICYMPFVFLFSFKGAPSIFKFGYDGLAAALLAMEHLNTGNGTIVSELNGIDQTCPLKFTTKGFDTEALPDIGLNHVTRITDRDRIASEGGLVPCALIGALKSSVSTPSSVISGVRGFPQISPLSTSSALDDGGLYPLFGRTIPNDDGTAIPLMSKLTSWGVKYLAVIYIDDSYGSAYVKGILHAAEASPSIYA